MSLVQNRFHGNGLYIMDEPEAALSPLRQLTLLSEINRLVELDSQFIIATHSPILLAYPNAKIYQITDNAIEEVRYEDCEHYKVTKQFLDNPNHFLSICFQTRKQVLPFVPRYPDVSPGGFPYAETPVSHWLTGFSVCP